MASTDPEKDKEIAPDSEVEKIGKEVFSQLIQYETSGHIGVTIMLYVIVVIGLLLTIYTLAVLAIKTHRWTVQTLLFVEMILVYTLLMPISLLHPYTILVTDKFVMLTMSSWQKIPLVQGLVLAYYMNFIYTFSTAFALISANFARIRWKKRNAHAMSTDSKFFLCILNIPITILGVAGFSFFTKFVETRAATDAPIAFVMMDVCVFLYRAVLILFSVIILGYIIYCFCIHRLVELDLHTSTLDEKATEIFNIELQMFFGCFYGIFPFVILGSSFLMFHTTTKIIISEFVMFCNIFLPIFACLMTLSAHKSLHWPRFLRRLNKKVNMHTTQWALPRQSSTSLNM